MKGALPFFVAVLLLECDGSVGVKSSETVDKTGTGKWGSTVGSGEAKSVELPFTTDAKGSMASVEVGPATTRISVVIPCISRDVEVFESRTLPSIAKQTLKPMYIVVALSETNRTRGEELEERWSRAVETVGIKMVVLSTTEKHSAGGNRNRALNSAQVRATTIVSFFDADDVMHPRRLEAVESVMRSNKGAAAILHSFVVAQKGTGDFPKISPKIWNTAVSTPEHVVESSVELASRLATFASHLAKGEPYYLLEAHGHASLRTAVAAQPEVEFRDSPTRGEDTDFVNKVHTAGYEILFLPLPLTLYFPSGADTGFAGLVSAWGNIERGLLDFGDTTGGVGEHI